MISLYIFNEKLKLVSKLSGIAKGEKIYSARFLGNRAYLVAFDQTDPFFTLELSDHKALLFDKDKRIMAIPIVIDGDNVFECDVYVYKINLKGGFKLVYKGKSDGHENITSRAAYIGDTLYTVFDSKIVAVDMNSFKDIGELKF